MEVDLGNLRKALRCLLVNLQPDDLVLIWMAARAATDRLVAGTVTLGFQTGFLPLTEQVRGACLLTKLAPIV